MEILELIYNHDGIRKCTEKGQEETFGRGWRWNETLPVTMQQGMSMHKGRLGVCYGGAAVNILFLSVRGRWNCVSVSRKCGERKRI